MDVLRSSLVSFVPDKQFLFFAPVCRDWRAAWGQRSTLTNFVSSESTIAQVRYSLECGLPRDEYMMCEALARDG